MLLQLNKRMVALITMAACLVTGCSTVGPRASKDEENIAKFRERYPAEARLYSHLCPANIERYWDIHRIEAGVILLTMQRLKRQFPGHEELALFADNQSAGAVKRTEELAAQVQELRRLSVGSRTLCEFEYKNSASSEWGFIILEDGEVVRREVWAEGDVIFPRPSD